MQWTDGLILRIRNYTFNDDNSVRDKYAIVLHANDNEAYVIHSLTTSKNNPGVPAVHYGCSVHRNIPYYYIPQGQLVGNESFCFESDTFIFFGNNVRKESYAKFEAASKVLFGVIRLGVLSADELKRIIKCALKSNYLPESIERELSAVKMAL